MVAWGPIEYRGAEIAAVIAFVVLVPPFVFAFLGSFVHAFVIARRDGKVAVALLLPLFLKWWMWSTLGWIGAWVVEWRFL